MISLNYYIRENKAYDDDNEDEDDCHFDFLRSKMQRTRQSPTAQNCLTVLSKVIIMMMMVMMMMMMMMMEMMMFFLI